jgi:hypothetical protein
MIFFFKKQKLVVDCFTYRQDIYKHNPIDYASKFYPSWWKNTPSSFKNDFYEASTIKKCSGIIDTYQKGFMIPLWNDFAFKVENKKIFWTHADHESQCEAHDHRQWQTYADINKYSNLKIISPWLMKCKNDINFYFTKPFWNHPLNTPYHILSGVSNMKYNHGTNILLMIDNHKDYDCTMEAGTPIVHIVPFTEKKLIIKNHLIDISEFEKMDSERWKLKKFVGAYLKSVSNIKKQDKKCPFHF